MVVILSFTLWHCIWYSLSHYVCVTWSWRTCNLCIRVCLQIRVWQVSWAHTPRTIIRAYYQLPHNRAPMRYRIFSQVKNSGSVQQWTFKSHTKPWAFIYLFINTRTNHIDHSSPQENESSHAKEIQHTPLANQPRAQRMAAPRMRAWRLPQAEGNYLLSWMFYGSCFYFLHNSRQST
jgi:hypothetical protein